MKLKKKIIMLTTLSLCTLFTTTIYASNQRNFDVLTFDENGLPTSGLFNDNSAKGPMSEPTRNFLRNNAGIDDVGGNLVYIRNGYGGGVSDPNSDKTEHQKSYSFNILQPFDAAGDTFYKQEDYSFKYIPENRTYKPGSLGRGAYGYPSKYGLPNKSNAYTLKLIQANPSDRTFTTDFSGNIPMVTMTKGKKAIWGEYRFNGISGNGKSINNPFFPDDAATKVSSVPESKRWNKNTATAALTKKPCSKYNNQILTLVPFGQTILMGEPTFENDRKNIAQQALDTYFDYFFHGGKAAAYAIRPWQEWNEYIKIENSPLAGSATYSIEFKLSGGGQRYNSMIIPSEQINDIALKSIVVFDVDEDGKLIQKADGSYQTMAEFTRQEELISSQFGNQRVNAPLMAGKDYVVGVNIMNVNSKKTKTINFENNPKIEDVVYLNTYSVNIPEVDNVLKLPKEVKYLKNNEGQDSLVREPIYGEWLNYRETLQAFDWGKLNSNGFEYKTQINSIKMNDHKTKIDSLTFANANKSALISDASIVAGINSVDGGYNPDALIKTKGNGNAMIITAKLPIAPDYNSNKQNDIGWLIVPVSVNDMGMDKMVVKDPQGKIVPNGGSLDKNIPYTIDYVVKKVAGEKKVGNTTVLTKAIDKNNKSVSTTIEGGYYSSKEVNSNKILSIGNPVDNKGTFKLIRDINPTETIKVCGEIDKVHKSKGENIINKNDFICQEFKGEKNDMSVVEIKLKDPANGKYVTEVVPNKDYEAIITVKKETGQKVVKPTTLDTTINGGDKTKNATDKPLEPSKTVDITRPIKTPNNADKVEICGEIVTEHDMKGDNIRNAGDKLCKVFGKKLNFYVQNLQANPRQVLLPDNQSNIPHTPIALSFKAGFESVKDDTKTVQIVIRDYQNRVVWSENKTFISGQQKNIVAPIVVGNIGLGNYQYTVEVNPNKNPSEVIPDGDPYKDNTASTSFNVARNFNCFKCYEKNTRIDWTMEYTTTVSPGEPYEYSYSCNCTSSWCSHSDPADSHSTESCDTCWAWACKALPEYKTVDHEQVDFFEIYRFEQILFRSKYTQDNVSAMRNKGVNISNDGWLDILHLPYNLKKFVGIKSGYGFELKVVTYYDHNFSCDRDIPGPTVECKRPDPDRETRPIDCWDAYDDTDEISYQGYSTRVPTGGFLPSYITPQTNDFAVCIEWPFRDVYGNTSKTKMDLTGVHGSRPNGVRRVHELPSRDVVKKNVFERKMYVHRDVAPNVVSGPTYTINLQTNRKQGVYTPKGARQGYLQDCFSFEVYIVGKMEEDIITHIMD